MGAPTGNQFWKKRSSHGRSPLFADPDVLWEAACEYFEWVESNPLWEDKVTSFQGVNTHEPIMKMRAMTMTGLCIFLDISPQTWSNYKNNKDFVEITTRIENVIRTQKFEGAAAELLNANIIARDLGLMDVNRTEVTGKDGGPVETGVTVQFVDPGEDVTSNDT
ncbi:MAG: putative terminase small subunit [Prokaryotic dsDNA virus sp.]|nr:MAG: putative terminase small subunit [Prokaryotic dsDNA virus sp.]|tara:strand:- start:20114 stop:20605 length:492 start_codon:yes stop_codon:yes gene_type:complete